MKLQAKISLIFIVSLTIASALSFLIMNLLAALYDNSYSWRDLNMVAIDVSRDLSQGPITDKNFVRGRLTAWKAQYPNLDFIAFSGDHQPVYATNPSPPPRPQVEELQKRLAQEEQQMAGSASLRFIDSYDRSPYMVAKPVVGPTGVQGLIMVSVRDDFFLPFYIRINKDKILESTLIFFGAIGAVIAISFLLVFLFTSPIIRRLQRVYVRINAFRPELPADTEVDAWGKDEIGFVQNTFNTMAARIQQDFRDRERSFAERQELLRNISHDFRTPLTSILGYASSLEDGVYENEEDRKRSISIIRKKALYMTKLFGEMMELTRLDNVEYVLNKSRFNLAELVREIIIEYLPQLEETGFAFQTEVPETLEINGDRERLSRAIRNLIDNVATHAAEGKYIGVSLVPASEASDASGAARLEVTDHGTGVAAGEGERIFERFYAGKAGGMGLGLAIAKEIIEKHRGTIAVENIGNTADSAAGASGARFVVTLPMGEE